MKKGLSLLLILMILFGCVSYSAADGDLFEVTEAVTKEFSPDNWKAILTLKNNTEEAVHDLSLTVCFTDEQGNIIYTDHPSANARVKAGKAITFDAIVAKELNPYAVYVDQVVYFDSSDEQHKVYLDNTEEFRIDTASLAAPEATEEPSTPEPTATPTAEPTTEPTPEPTATPEPTQEPASDPIQITGCVAGANASFTVINNTGKKLTQVAYRVKYYDSNDQYNFINPNGKLDQEFVNDNWTVVYDETGMDANEIRDLYCDNDQAFIAADHVEIALLYYIEQDGSVYYVPESRLHWYSSAQGAYISSEVPSNDYVYPDQETLDKAQSFMLGINMYEVFPEYLSLFNLSDTGWYIHDFMDESLLRDMGMETGDIIISAGGFRWADDPMFLDRAKARIADGESITFFVNRNGKIKTFSVGPDDIKKVQATPTPELQKDRIGTSQKETAQPTEAVQATATPTETPVPPPAANRSVKIISDDSAIYLGTKKKLTLTAEVKVLREDAPKQSELVWSSDNNGIAKVDSKGVLTGVKPGTAVITCSLKDDPEIRDSITVNVVKPVTGIKLSEKSLSLMPGQAVNVSVTLTPKDATIKDVEWKSTNILIANVNASGSITARGGGDCEIICTTKDGAKKASIKVHVIGFKVDKTEYTVTSKSGIKIPVQWYSFGTLYLTDNGGSYFNANWGEENEVIIEPLKAGKGSIVIYSKDRPKDKVTISITIDHSAAYDTQSYPAINYDGAMRYPDSYKGDKVSFSGRVLQVMSGSSTTTYRISSRGRSKNVVYVTINNSDIGTPIIDNDKVTVYGTYDGLHTYNAVLGNSVTIPHVIAEKIIVK